VGDLLFVEDHGLELVVDLTSCKSLFLGLVASNAVVDGWVVVVVVNNLGAGLGQDHWLKAGLEASVKDCCSTNGVVDLLANIGRL
jgi:hypothetical protein